MERPYSGLPDSITAKFSAMKLLPVKLIVFSLFFLMGRGASAQYALGGGLDYNVDVKRSGLFLRGTLRPDSLWRVAGTFNYFFQGSSKTTQWELAFDGHYFFWENARLRSYLIGGVNLYHHHSTALAPDTPPADERGNKFAINLGAGLQTRLNERVYPFAEMKVSVGDGSLFGVFVGFTYRLELRKKG